MKHANKKNGLIILFIIFSTMVFSFGYTLRLVFSDYRDISTHSLERFILIPAILRGSELVGPGETVGYSYHAADGEKPSIAEISIMTSEEERNLVPRIKNYFLLHGFEDSFGDGLKKGNQEIAISIEERDMHHCLVKVALIERI